MRAVQPIVERLSQFLGVESLLVDAAARTEAQQLATRLHFPLQQLYVTFYSNLAPLFISFCSGVAQNVLASRVSTLRVNDTPGSARFQGILVPGLFRVV